MISEKWCIQKFQKNKLILEGQTPHNLSSRENQKCVPPLFYKTFK